MTKETAEMGRTVLYRVDNEGVPGIQCGRVLRFSPNGRFVQLGYQWHRADNVSVLDVLEDEPADPAAATAPEPVTPPATSPEPATPPATAPGGADAPPAPTEVLDPARN